MSLNKAVVESVKSKPDLSVLVDEFERLLASFSDKTNFIWHKLDGIKTIQSHIEKDSDDKETVGGFVGVMRDIIDRFNSVESRLEECANHLSELAE